MQCPRNLHAGLIIFINFLLLLGIVGVVGNFKFLDVGTSEEMPNPANSKFEGRGPIRELPDTGSSPLQVRPTAKTELRFWTVFSEAGQDPSLWTHDGSILRLEAVGRARRFYYVLPHGGFPAKSGDIAFEGVREGPTYSGRAFQFSENCTPLAYQVKGSVSSDQSAVKMRGRKPLRNAQCNVISYVDNELVFSLTNRL